MSIRNALNISSSSSSSDGGESLIEPVLPWLEKQDLSSTASSSRTSASSDIHIIKRHPPEGGVISATKQRKFWKWQKLWLLMMNTLLFSYGLVALVLGLCTYFKLYQRALVFLIGEKIIVNLIITAGVFCLFTSLLGFAGIMLNNRILLTLYNVMLWPCFGIIASIGYYCYRKAKWNLEGKLSFQWHYRLSSEDRANIQANLHCCGYKMYSDFHEMSNKCYPRTLYPGCKFKYQTLMAESLRNTWIAAFSMIPLHIIIMFSAILCSNHVNNTFGKGLPPKLYRIDYKALKQP